MSASPFFLRGWHVRSPIVAFGGGRSNRRTCRTMPPSPLTAARSEARRACKRGPAAGRGGVSASLVGPKTVIAAEDAATIAGFIINKFRGDPSLFNDGMAAIARHTGWQPLGLVPFFELAHRLPAEDALGLVVGPVRGRSDRPLVVVLASP